MSTASPPPERASAGIDPRRSPEARFDAARGVDRRRFLAASALAVAGELGAAGRARAAGGRLSHWLSANAGASPSGHDEPAGVGADPPPTIAPIRPPAAPLAVRSPYLSSWQRSTVAPGSWQTHWTSDLTALAGIARIDGAAYAFAGDPQGSPTVPGLTQALAQTALHLTATRTVYTLRGAGVELGLTYLSPVEPGDVRRQSIPMSYVLVSARSVDGREHEVAIYLDVDGGWLTAEAGPAFSWAPRTIAAATGPVQAWSFELVAQTPLSETGDRADWGSVVWATQRVAGLSHQAGPAASVRSRFVASGTLTNVSARGLATIHSPDAPVFAFAMTLGRVGATPQTRQLSLGHVRTPIVSYLGRPLPPLWIRHWSSWEAMLGFFHADGTAAHTRAQALDARIAADATAAGGSEYAALCALALRQAYGATELAVGPDGTPWAFLKEISTNGDTSTVDVIFPASPVWIYLDPAYLALLLKPIFGYPASGRWTARFAPHDLGHYPRGDGYAHDGGENMPVEESADMLIMAAAYAQAAPGPVSRGFLKANYRWCEGWADYLISALPDPGLQNQTDDFAGRIAHSVNLAIKGIVGVAAMGQIASALGRSTDALHYTMRARSLIAIWLRRAQDPSGTHLDLTYSGAGAGDGTWGTLYNAFADTLLGTGLVPESVAAEQAAYYRSVLGPFGLPLQLPHIYAKSDWELWTAGWLHAHPIARTLVARVYAFANTTDRRAPFPDLYGVSTDGAPPGIFRARPVQGAMFSLLARQALADARAG